VRPILRQEAHRDPVVEPMAEVAAARLAEDPEVDVEDEVDVNESESA